MSPPKLLDLFCGAGGASVGYARAGFQVSGVDDDYRPLRNYPYGHRLTDAMDILEDTGSLWQEGWDVIHASPPCQAYTVASQSRRNAGQEYPDLIAPVRAALEAWGGTWIIENVPKAPMRADYRLCGCMFGLELRRVRWFETSWGGFDLSPPHYHRGPVPSVTGHGTPSWVRDQLGHNPTIADYRAAMGIDWMNRDQLSQAIPPAYTEYLGAQLIDHLADSRA